MAMKASIITKFVLFPIVISCFLSVELYGQTENQAVEDAPDIFTIVEKMPEFTGGSEELYEYLAKNIIYPKKAKKKKIEGTVYVTFVVNEMGKIENCRILRGIGYGCDDEALRVVKAMPAWTPGMQRGKPVKVQFNMPLKFVLGEDK